MSLFSTLTVSLSGLQAVSTQLQVTANNISNAGQEGFTRKTAIVTTASLGEIGGGAKVDGFERASNIVLFTTLTKAQSDASMRSTQDNYLQQVQNLLGTSSSDDPPLSQVVTAFSNAWAQLEAEPESLVAQRQVVQNASNMVEEIKRIAGAIEDLDRQCFADVNTTISDLNSYLDQIKDLNLKISQAQNAGQSSGDLEDQRDKLILSVADITGITILQRPLGQIALYTTSGYQLVDGAEARSFTYNGTNVTSLSNPGLVLNDTLTGGSLEALIDFRTTSTPASTEPGSNVIQKLREQMDVITNGFLTTVTTATSGEVTFAQAYNSATTGAGELANNFFTGTNRTDLAVNASLLDGSARVKSASASGVSDALLDATRSFSAAGLTISNVSYNTLTTSVLTSFQQAANNIQGLSNTAESRQSYLKQKLTNETNVNVDTEMVSLVTYQNTYAASARCLSVVKDLFQILNNII